jgi:predicted Ser/Thr protein kinase
VFILKVSGPAQSVPFRPLASHSNTSTGTLLLPVNGALIGGLIGGIVGVLLVVGGIVVLVIFLRKKRKKSARDRNNEELPMEEQTKSVQTNQQQTHESEIQSQITNPSSHYISIAKSTAQSKTSQITQNIELSAKHRIPFEDIEVKKEIGKGSYGKVCLGQWSGATVALKFCKEKEGLEDFWKEANLMIELPPHPNVVQMFGVSTDGTQPVLVLEYCGGGSLDKLLFFSEQPMNETQNIILVKGIAAGMLHLHNHNIIHRDLAARNILLSDAGHPKISDFGMSRILQKEDEGQTKTNIGPVRWMAPESLAKQTYSKKSDVWSFGIVVYEIVARREPHTEVNPLDVGPLIRDQLLTPKIPDDCSPILRELMQLCWQADPNQRPSFKEICRLLDH